MPVRTPIEFIMARCIKEEVKAFLTYSTDEATKKRKEDARSWLFDDKHQDPEDPLSLQNICTTLQKPKDVLRAEVSRAERMRLTFKEYINFKLYGKQPPPKRTPVKAKG